MSLLGSVVEILLLDVTLPSAVALDCGSVSYQLWLVPVAVVAVGVGLVVPLTLIGLVMLVGASGCVVAVVDESVMVDKDVLTVKVTAVGGPLVDPMGATGVCTPVPKGTVPRQPWLLPIASVAVSGEQLVLLSLVDLVALVAVQVRVAVQV